MGVFCGDGGFPSYFFLHFGGREFDLTLERVPLEHGPGGAAAVHADSNMLL